MIRPNIISSGSSKGMWRTRVVDHDSLCDQKSGFKRRFSTKSLLKLSAFKCLK